MLGVGISDLDYFKEVPGPATAGILSILAAVLSRLLPDLTLSRLPKTQLEIERQQFPSRLREQRTQPQRLSPGIQEPLELEKSTGAQYKKHHPGI